MPFEKFKGFPLDPARREKDSTFEDEFIEACSGKSILLVEPLLVDRGLDEAFEEIMRRRGIINGVVTMFEVKGVSPKSLINHAELAKRCCQVELRGQIVLDLHESR
jgi:hypothetical protein